MAMPIVYIDRSRIRDAGRIGELRAMIDELVAFIEEREPQLISYGFSVDEEAGTMTVIAVHPDAASLEYHMQVGAEGFRRFVDLIDMQGIEVYGEPGDAARRELARKAADLGEAGRVTVSPYYAGFGQATATEPR